MPTRDTLLHITPIHFPADLLPPRAFLDQASQVRLDSGFATGAWSRWTYFCEAPTLLLRCDPGNHVTGLYDAHGLVREWYNPLDALAWMEQHGRIDPRDGPPFKGGWVGFLGYDLGRLFEVLPARARDDLHLPLFQFTYHPRVWAHDLLSRQGWKLALPDEGRKPIVFTPSFPLTQGEPVSTFLPHAYRAAVKRVVEYIAAGDVFQVNLSQRFTCALREPPHRIYDRLRHQAPAWFGAYLGYGSFALLCNSPELFLRVDPDAGAGRRVVTRPIKGTRPRKPGMDEELRKSLKDQAELNMIVDLERNDLGRVCRVGSVRVTEARAVEAHPTVFHGAATVEGVLRDGVGLVDLLAATFPGGSITGAPKIRAMQIIDELEPVRRGPYCGAIGYLSADGALQLNIAIRTMIVAHGSVHVPVGGGIVADSDPAAEYEETLVKARAMLEALGVDVDGLRG